MNGVKVIERYNQRLLTTEQLADFYEASSQQIKQNFSYNKDKFIEDKHFYRLEGAELKEFKDLVENSDLVDKRAPQLILWTKQGASRHSKMLGTDKAWDMFDLLEENYFTPKEKQIQLPSDPMEILALTFKAQEQTNGRVEKVEKDVDYLKNNVKLEPGNYNFVSRHIGQKINRVIRDRNLNKKAQAPLRKELNSAVNTLAGVRTRSQMKDKDFDRVVDFIDRWEPSTLTMDLVRQLELELDQQGIA